MKVDKSFMGTHKGRSDTLPGMDGFPLWIKSRGINIGGFGGIPDFDKPGPGPLVISSGIPDRFGTHGGIKGGTSGGL